MNQYLADGHHRKHHAQPYASPEWQAHKKHYFILSSSGKPVYSRYGNEAEQASIMGLVQAFLSVFLLQDDPLRYIRNGDQVIVFYIAGPLYYVVVSRTHESVAVLAAQLEMMHACVIFTLTSVQLAKIFDRHLNYDLRSLMGGTDVLLDKLAKSFSDPWLFLDAMPTIKAPAKTRRLVSKVWTAAAPPTSNVFGLMVANKKILATFHGKRHSLLPRDAALVLNMVYSSSTFQAVESWAPVCLPLFNSSGFLYCYVSFITPSLCLITLSTDRDSFFEQSDFKSRVVEGLGSDMETISSSIASDPDSVVRLGIPGLRHCLVCCHSSKRYYEPRPVAPYTSSGERKRLIRLYQEVASRMAAKAVDGTLAFHVSDSEAVFVQKSAQLEVFLAFSPLIKRDAVLEASNYLQDQMQRSKEQLFL
ncbi:Vacuolar fusion protein mon1b [Kappamyces sp. JEL0829]|nr:Vacuolar fusion protein mon1b [Kappamyces sp. JEL0829]